MFEMYMDDGQMKIQSNENGCIGSHIIHIYNKINMGFDDFKILLKTHGAIITSNPTQYSPGGYEYYFNNKSAIDKCIGELNSLLIIEQQRLEIILQQKKADAKIKNKEKRENTRVYIETTINGGLQTFKIINTIKENFKDALWSGNINYNYYVVGVFSQNIAKKICVEFEKYQFNDFIEAIVKIREIAEPYLIMEKLTK